MRRVRAVLNKGFYKFVPHTQRKSPHLKSNFALKSEPFSSTFWMIKARNYF